MKRFAITVAAAAFAVTTAAGLPALAHGAGAAPVAERVCKVDPISEHPGKGCCVVDPLSERPGCPKGGHSPAA